MKQSEKATGSPEAPQFRKANKPPTHQHAWAVMDAVPRMRDPWEMFLQLKEPKKEQTQLKDRE